MVAWTSWARLPQVAPAIAAGCAMVVKPAEQTPRVAAAFVELLHEAGVPRETLALLNGLLAVATALPVFSSHPVAVFASGLLFGSVFLSLVASTTALVRHNLPPSAWAAGISAFTTVFAAGQIAGPTVVGWIADGPGGLARGLIFSAAALWLGSVLALRQKAL